MTTKFELHCALNQHAHDRGRAAVETLLAPFIREIAVTHPRTLPDDELLSDWIAPTQTINDSDYAAVIAAIEAAGPGTHVPP